MVEGVQKGKSLIHRLTFKRGLGNSKRQQDIEARRNLGSMNDQEVFDNFLNNSNSLDIY